MATSKNISLVLLMLIAGIISLAMAISSSFSAPILSESHESSTTRTSIVIQTVNLTTRLTATIPETAFSTALVTSTVLNYSNITVTVRNATGVSTMTTTITE